MIRIGVVGVKEGWSSELLADRAAALGGGERLLIDMERVRLDLDKGRALYEGIDLIELDCLLVKKVGAAYSPHLLDRLEALRYVAGRGVRVFSDPERILRVLDRLSCTVTLRLNDIPMPPTSITEDVDQALAALEEYGEAVVKPLYSTKARGMFLIRPGVEAREQLADFLSSHQLIYLQKTIPLDGMDLGVVFLGGEYLTTYARQKTNGAWNTTINSGGKYVPFDPPQDIIDLAHKAQAPFGLDFTCVDVALTKDGPFIFEVSAFGGFRGLHEARNMDPATLFVQHAIKRTRS